VWRMICCLVGLPLLFYSNLPAILLQLSVILVTLYAYPYRCNRRQALVVGGRLAAGVRYRLWTGMCDDGASGERVNWRLRRAERRRVGIGAGGGRLMLWAASARHEKRRK